MLLLTDFHDEYVITIMWQTVRAAINVLGKKTDDSLSTSINRAGDHDHGY